MRIQAFIRRGVTLALISVLLNVYLIYRLTRLETRLASQVSLVATEATYAHSEASNVTSLLKRWREEQQWLDWADFAPQTVTPGGVILKGTFALRRLAPGTEVILQFRPAATTTWEEAATRRVNDLNYEAEFTVTPDKAYEYRLVARTQNGQEASEIIGLPANVHRRPPLLPQVSQAKGGSQTLKTFVTLDSAFPTLIPGFRPVAATLAAYEGEQVKFSQDFTPAGEHPEIHLFVLEGISLPPGTDLYLSVRYANGYEKKRKSATSL